jgi:hypothetical protein
MTMVLHAWGQTLQHHPYVHCVVPGGEPSLDGTRWVTYRPGFLLPVRVLGRLFRRLFLQELENTFNAGKLRFFTNHVDLPRFGGQLRAWDQGIWSDCIPTAGISRFPTGKTTDWAARPR